MHLPNGQFAEVTHSGNIVLEENIVLTDVLCVPTFAYNLLSIPKLIKNTNCKVFFSDKSCFLQDPNLMKATEIGSRKEGLYLLNKTPVHSLSPSLLHSNKVCNTMSCKRSILWHSRLGHPSVQSLKVLPFDIVNFPVTINDCDICHLAKDTKVPFPTSSTISGKLFDLVHVDIWGPYKHKTHGNCSYFLTLVEDKSKATWTYLFTEKTQVIHLMQTFLAHVNNHFSATVKTVRSDYGTELVNQTLHQEFAKLGITH